MADQQSSTPVSLREYGVYVLPAVEQNGKIVHPERYVVANGSDEGGYLLTTINEWASSEGPDWTATEDGAIEFQGDPFRAGGLTIANLEDTGWEATDRTLIFDDWRLLHNELVVDGPGRILIEGNGAVFVRDHEIA